jgi:pectin methylesterase-like acyl-CoA thioesterase
MLLATVLIASALHVGVVQVGPGRTYTTIQPGIDAAVDRKRDRECVDLDDPRGARATSTSSTPSW